MWEIRQSLHASKRDVRQTATFMGNGCASVSTPLGVTNVKTTGREAFLLASRPSHRELRFWRHSQDDPHGK